MVTLTTLDPRRFPGHAKVVSVTDPDSALNAIIAIHSTVRGPTLGVCRMMPYPLWRDALRDALRLSRSMACRTALAGVGFGGGSCVLIGDPPAPKSPAYWQALADALDRLGGMKITGDDIGMSAADSAALLSAMPQAGGPAPETEPACPTTAHGVFLAIQAALAHRFASPDLNGRSVMVQGLGRIGAPLCKLLHEAGAVLHIADPDPARVAQVQRQFNARAVPMALALAAEVDVLSPNAAGDMFDDVTVGEVHARIIAGGATSQLRLPRHGLALHRRGVLYVPDYVAGAGNVIALACALQGKGPVSALQSCEPIFHLTRRILAQAERLGLTTLTAADALADHRLARGTGQVRTQFAGSAVAA